MRTKQVIYPRKKLLVKKFKKIIKTFTKKLDNYIEDPNEANIHDIRIAIRRMGSIYKILPKKNRKAEGIQDYVKQAKALFNINTQMRDFDIICAKLKKRHPTQFNQIIDSINGKRKHQLNAGHRLALKLKSISPPRLKEKDVMETKLRKRFQKIISELIDEIDRNIPIVLNDDKKIEEIHELRKDFKKLRYSIELTSDKIDSLKSIKSLKKIQDELGSIHDSDMFLDYLRGVEGPHELSETIREEILERREKYQRFVQVFKNEGLDNPRKLIL
ncbi:MAG: CHAD domain-containing protein [Thaumarchaeota archaeon]|nr:CHAD domain-containing protein [Nitrososphaerota archaeon]